MNLWILLSLTLANAYSPTGGYAPGNVTCPNKSLIREADGLSSEEQQWLSHRNPITKSRINEFLSSSNLTDFDVDDFMDQVNDTIKLGIAFSGGGFRAMFNGAGQLLGLDDRFEDANTYGLGGILQSSTYLAGLSGGNWLVGSFVFSNFTPVNEILDKNKIWDVENSIINVAGWNIIDAVKYYTQIYEALSDKADAGYERSITDIWGRALSYQLLTTYPRSGVDLCWSDIRDLPHFANHSMPFPVVVADGRTPGQYIISGNSTILEINPFELGSWDDSLKAFVDTKYLGTELDGGKPKNDTCVAGYDNAGFIMGTSSSLFNQIILQLGTVDLPKVISGIIEKILSSVSKDEDDIAIYEPNPFLDTRDGNDKTILGNDTLFLCDGSEDNQNVPLYPLIQPARNLDVIFAFDNSADTEEKWPDGASIIATYERQFLPQGNGTLFPYVPDNNTFVNLNLTSKPTFFGCDIRNLTDLKSNLPDDVDEDYWPPLVIYMANRPFSHWTNTSTFKLSYDDDKKKGIIQNGFEVATRLNGTLDEEWRACVSCAIIRRTQERLNISQTEQCERCFERYCWNGDVDAKTVTTVNFTVDGVTNGIEDTISSFASHTSSSDSGSGKKSGAAKTLPLIGSIIYGALFVVYLII